MSPDILIDAGVKARALYRHEDAHGFFVAAIQAATDSDDRSNEIRLRATEALARNARDYWPAGQGDPFQMSHKLSRETLSQYRIMGNLLGIARTLRMLAPLEPENSAAMLDESLRICRQLNNQQGIAETLMMMGNLSDLPDDKRALLQEALTEAKQSGDQGVIAQVLQSIAVLSTSDVEQEEDAFDDAIEMRRSLGLDAFFVILILMSTAFGSNVDKRKALLTEALEVSCRLTSFDLAKMCMDRLAGLNKS